MSKGKQGIWSNPLLRSRISSPDVRPPEMLLGYLIGPFGALQASAYLRPTPWSRGWTGK